MDNIELISIGVINVTTKYLQLFGIRVKVFSKCIPLNCSDSTEGSVFDLYMANTHLNSDIPYGPSLNTAWVESQD